MPDITKSPLCWPPAWPRTQKAERTRARFGRRNSNGWGNESLTIAQATRRVTEELGRFTKVGRTYRVDPDSIIVSTNLRLRLDGLPRSNQPEPTDPGVAVYFELDGKQQCVPCDSFDRVADNLAAVAGTLDALRKIERYGSQMFQAAFTGFDALPAPDQIIGRSWRDVLDYYGDDLAQAEKQYKRKRGPAHPDHGGSADQLNELQEAIAQARQALGD